MIGYAGCPMSRSRLLFALATLAALGGALLLDSGRAGAGSSIISITVEPSAPTDLDITRMTVAGELYGVCHASSSHIRSGNAIAIFVGQEPGNYCAAVYIAWPFSVTEEIGQLPAGDYQVVVYAGVIPEAGLSFHVSGASVGGIARLPDVDGASMKPPASSRSHLSAFAWLAGGVAAGAAALASAAWYARSKRPR